jgi:hypothetical protein
MQENARGRKAPGELEIISNFETQLESTLSPVKPNPEFIQHLRKRLTTTPVMILEGESRLLDAMIALGLVMSGILILVTILWGVYKALVATGVIETD